MSTFVRYGEAMTVKATEEVTAGQIVVLEDTVGVAESSAKVGQLFTLVLTGVHSLPLADSVAPKQGQRAYVIKAEKKVTTDKGSDNALIGIFDEAKDASGTDRYIKVNVGR